MASGSDDGGGSASYQDAIISYLPNLTLAQCLLPLGFVLFVLSLWIVRHYAMPGTSPFILFLTAASFTFGFFGLALMPIDLSLTVAVEDG